MKRALITMAALVMGLSPAANAALSVVIVADNAIYLVNDTITLTVTVTADGGEASTQAFGEILLDNPSALTGGNVTPAGLESFGGGLPWVMGTNPCSTSTCTAMNQIGGVSPFPVTNTPLNIAIITYTAAAPGIVNVTWEASTFDWFGMAVPAGTSFEVLVPEPTTAAMLGLGLFGLAFSGRRANRK